MRKQQEKRRSEGHRRLLVVGVFATFLLIGILVHKEYGVSADEPTLRQFGYEVYGYVFWGWEPSRIFDWKIYGPIVPLSLTVAENITGFSSGPAAWGLRHVLQFLGFFAGIACFYRIARLRFPRSLLPLLGAVFFMVSPRFFAHAFYNPKDIPTLTLFTASIYTLLLLERKRTWKRTILHALISALVISARSFTLFIGGCTALALLWPSPKRGTSDVRRNLLLFCLYATYTALFLMICWPLLWHDPVRHFLSAFQQNAAFGGNTKGTPWWYLPLWMGITIPPLYTGLFLLGGIVMGWRILRWSRYEWMLCLWIGVPVMGVWLGGTSLFNEWRHLFFLYPAVLLVALEGMHWLWIHPLFPASAPWWRRGLAACITLCVASTAFWMFRNHPYEYGYFSLPVPAITQAEAIDYWSLSYREGFSYILAHDRRPIIFVHPVANVATISAQSMQPEEQRRLRFVPIQIASYILDATAGGDSRHIALPPSKIVHSITVDGRTILTIYRR